MRALIDVKCVNLSSLLKHKCVIVTQLTFSYKKFTLSTRGLFEP